MDEPCVALDHPRFRSVWAAIFTRRLAADCMTHRCTMVEPGQEKLDACCQYGCDVDLAERAAIEARGDDIRALLRPEVKHVRWFDPEEEVDADYPSGRVVRTEVHGDGCIFLAHDQRGCAIHRAALEHGWSWRDVKPAVCQLFPLTYTTDAIVISDDYKDYSCAYLAGAPTLYRVAREALSHVFGAALVTALDAVEARVTARRLPLL